MDLYQHTLPDTHQGYGPSGRVTSPPIRYSREPFRFPSGCPHEAQGSAQTASERGRRVPDAYGVAGSEAKGSPSFWSSWAYSALLNSSWWGHAPAKCMRVSIKIQPVLDASRPTITMWAFTQRSPCKLPEDPSSVPPPGGPYRKSQAGQTGFCSHPSIVSDL